MKCSHCGKLMGAKMGGEYEEEEMGEEGEGYSSSEDSDLDIKDSVLADLIEAMQGTVAKDLGKKPAMIAVEIKKKG